MGEFDGKVALVTGAARGIGQASALAFARRGASVVVCDLLDTTDTVQQIEDAGGKASVSAPTSRRALRCKTLWTAAVSQFGRLDFAHNNAGTFAPVPLADLDEADWDRVIAVNLTGVFLCLKHQIPEILKTGGAIVNTASIWSFAGAERRPPTSPASTASPASPAPPPWTTAGPASGSTPSRPGRSTPP